jgi:hypothetical protein
MAVFTAYPDGLEFEVLKLEYMPHSGLVYAHTDEFVCHIPRYWSPKCNFNIKVPYWNKLPDKLLRYYWLSEDEIRWELWAQNRLIGWWSVLFD